MSNPKHVTIKDFTPLEEGTMQVDTKIYHEKLAYEKQEIIKHIQTSTSGLLSDLISCLDVLKESGTPELSIVVKMDRYNKPTMLIKTWTVSKQSYNRR